MITRIVAALVGLAVLVPALLFGGSVAVEIIVPIFGLICLWEYAGMAFPEDRPVAMLWLCITTSAIYCAALYAGERFVWPTIAVVSVATMIFATVRPGPVLADGAAKIGRYLVGNLWVGSIAFLPLLRRFEDGVAWVFLTLGVAWLSDTGGYFAGKFLGRRKLYERVSPKKTWEGLAGGLVFATVGCCIIKTIALPDVSYVECVFFGTVVASIGVLGDLSESLLKRAYNVKDSGSIMPGHGGILDRIDAMLFVAPVLYAFAVLVKGY